MLEEIDSHKLGDIDTIINYIRNNNDLGFANLSKVAEYANVLREDNEAFYTRPNICYTVVKNLPDASYFKSLHILEPSVGVGNFLPCIIEKYKSVKEVVIDICDIDSKSIDIVRELLTLVKIPRNIKINYIVTDFLLHDFLYHYDIVIGNPPY